MQDRKFHETPGSLDKYMNTIFDWRISRFWQPHFHISRSPLIRTCLNPKESPKSSPKQVDKEENRAPAVSNWDSANPPAQDSAGSTSPSASRDMEMIQDLDMSSNQSNPPPPPPNTPKEDGKEEDPAAGSNGDSKKPPQTWGWFGSWEPHHQESSEFPPEDSK
jgi:hypothetical protein